MPSPWRSRRNRVLGALMTIGVATTVVVLPPGPLGAEDVLVERLENTTFESGVTGWRAPSGSVLGTSLTAHSGLRSASVTRPGGGTTMLDNDPDVADVPAGGRCDASAWVKAPKGKAVRIRVREPRADGTTVEGVSGGSATGRWQQLAVSHTTARGRLDLNVWAGSMKSTQALLVDDVSLRCPLSSVLFREQFDLPDGLITNEYAHWNPTAADAVRSSAWDMTSGSLFASGSTGWSGVPDGESPGPTSSVHTGSSVFRLNTMRSDFGDVKVDMRLRVDELTTTTRTPAQSWDGIHIWLRYRAEEELYYASVDRRDGAIVIKKKCAGGATNGGTYYTLAAQWSGHPIPYGTWHDVAAAAKDNADGTVTLNLWRNGVLALTTHDNGVGCAPLRGAGGVGVRGDNANFRFDDFTVTAA